VSAALEDRPDHEREVVTTRLFDAPRERVYAAFSDPAALAAWWGPEGFSNRFLVFEFRPGGRWHFVMRAPDGQEFENESVFLETLWPERIVLRHLRPMHQFDATFRLSDEEGRTRLSWRMCFESSDECLRVRHLVVPANEQNLDRLQSQLEGR
jgi:uncharacterized protein YndB with AHSA1/START domain